MIIYEPKGKASEYSPLAANLYKGCSHGCVYCYAPSATFTDRDAFHKNVCPRKNVLSQFKKDAQQYNGDPRRILLSFTTDPYQPIEGDLGLTRQALEIMASSNLKVAVLTKGGMLPSRDFPLLAKMDAEFATTLTTDEEKESISWEPGAALPLERIESLFAAKRYGLKTWVSFEPVINPDAVLRLIDKTAQVVDFYKVGKLNHHKLSKEIDWTLFRKRVVAKLEKIGKPYMLKKDLLLAT